MAITQNITAMPTPALSRSLEPEAFIAAADADVVARGKLVNELNTFAAQANSTAAAMNLNSTIDSSVTSRTISIASKTFTVTAGKSFQVGMWLSVSSAAAPSTNQMIGIVTSYSGTSLVVDVKSILGSGTYADWVIAQSAPGVFVDSPALTGSVTINNTTGGNSLLIEDTTSPDPSPFVVDSTGKVIVGHTASVVIGDNSDSAQIINASASAGGLTTQRWRNDVNGTYMVFAKSRSEIIGTQSAVLAGDVLSFTRFYGDDGSAFVEAARITVQAESVTTGAIGGKYIFATTNTSGVLTNALAIGDGQEVVIGTSPPVAGRSLGVSRNITGSTGAYGILNNGQVQSDVTSQVIYSHVQLNSNAALTTGITVYGRHFTLGTWSGAAPTTVYANDVPGTTAIGATNYAYRSGYAAAAGTWAFYGAGTADSALGGNLRVGGTTAPVATVDVTGSIAATTSILSSGATSGIGYSAGAGGAVTQTTSRTTAVTINKMSGAITLFPAVTSTAWVTFTVYNSVVQETDVVIVNVKTSAYLYNVFVTQVNNGSFLVTHYSTAPTTSESPIINFVVIKGTAV